MDSLRQVVDGQTFRQHNGILAFRLAFQRFQQGSVEAGFMPGKQSVLQMLNGKLLPPFREQKQTMFGRKTIQ
ncbi:hypothetical protein D3C76_1092480 [compost metagenome]